MNRIAHSLTQLLPIPIETSLPPLISNVKSSISIQHLLAAQLHLGHAVESWNPNMMPFIYGSRQGIHIINLDHTLTHLRRAINITREIATRGGNILFLGTRPLLHPIVMEAAHQGNAYFMTHWIGGVLTNKERVLRRSVGFDPDKVIQEANSILSMDNESEGSSSNGKHVAKNQPFVHSPDLIIMLDMPNTHWAIREANYAGVPVIALCDTDCNPQWVQYPIPGNDDSISACKLIAGVLSRASLEGFERRRHLQAQAAHSA